MDTLTIAELIEQLTGDLAADLPVMVWGPPGVGKSDAGRTIAANNGPAVYNTADFPTGCEFYNGVPLVDIRLSQYEPADLRGVPFPDMETRRTVNLLPEVLPTVPVKFGLLFLDEITSAAPTVAAAAYQLILDRRLGDYRVPNGWHIVAAGNRLSDRGVVNPMPSPLANRFAHYEVAADGPAWVAWAKAAGIDPRIIAYISAVPASLFNLDVSQGDIRAFASPRSWAMLSRRFAVAGEGSDVLRTAAAYVGEAAAADFCAVLPVLDQLPTISEIQADPHGCRVPDTSGGNVSALAACFGIGNMISAAVIRDTSLLDTFYPYLERLPLREVIPACMADIMRNVEKADLIGTDSLRKFSLEFADMVV